MSPPKRNLAADRGIHQQQNGPPVSRLAEMAERRESWQNHANGNS
jgi:hypothetical protein